MNGYMTDIEVALTNVGEIAARDIALTEQPKGLKENLSVAKRGGGVAKGAKDLYEKETKKSAISKNNALDYKYIDAVKQIKEKKVKVMNKDKGKNCASTTINWDNPTNRQLHSNLYKISISLN